ncbi:MAG: glycosyltransferase [Halioglobus sp.]
MDHGTSSEGGLRYRLTRAMESRVFRRADAVTTICEGLRGDIVARGIAAGKVTVIPNAVAIGDFEFDAVPDQALRHRLGLRAEQCWVSSALLRLRGIAVAARCHAGDPAAPSEAVLLLVGGGPGEGTVERRIHELGIADAVVATGRVPHAEVSSYYGLVDIFAYPRLPMRLTELVTPLKPLEAMAQGKLVVASDVGGHRELIQDGENGFLFKAGSAPALAETVSALLESRERWPAIHRAGRHYVESDRNWANSVGRYRKVYEGLL